MEEQGVSPSDGLLHHLGGFLVRKDQFWCVFASPVLSRWLFRLVQQEKQGGNDSLVLLEERKERDPEQL